MLSQNQSRKMSKSSKRTSKFSSQKTYNFINSLISFSGIFYQKAKEERQKLIFDQYKFICDCEACTKDYPPIEGLPMFDQEFWKVERFNAFLTGLTIEEAIKEFNENCDYITQKFDRYPCMELVMIENRNKNLLFKIAQFASLIGNIPN